MRLLYLIGNGFDLRVGLHTAYPDFLKYYLKQPLPTDSDDLSRHFVERLKDDIKSNIELWSSLELQFGKHLSKFGSVGSSVRTIEEELDIVNDDLRSKLSAYISEEDNKSFFAENAKKRFAEDILKPEAHLLDYEKTAIANHRAKLWHLTSNTIDFITFNYTRTIEHLLGKTPLKVGNFEVHEPIHIHGYHDSRMILGVDDVSQIENDKLKKSEYATDVLIKSACNHTYGVWHTNQSEDLISKAQLICCYGLSFGDTDRRWWKRVCSSLLKRNDVIVVIFEHSTDINNYSNSGPKLQNKKRQTIRRFLKQGGVDETTMNSLLNRVYVSINDPIFNIQIDDRTPEEMLLGRSAPGTAERLAENLTNSN